LNGFDFSKGVPDIVGSVSDRGPGMSQRFDAINNMMDPHSSLEHLSGFDVLLAEGTPQQKAASWILQHDAFLIDLENDQAIFVERYAVVVLYYALGGDKWTSANGWLGHRDICDWFYVCCRIPGQDECMMSQGEPGHELSSVQRPNNVNINLCKLLQNCQYLMYEKVSFDFSRLSFFRYLLYST
jgi:hypothetical protein